MFFFFDCLNRFASFFEVDLCQVNDRATVIVGTDVETVWNRKNVQEVSTLWIISVR
jgi:hypothetical protein